jgi:hypothetical protein
MTAAAITTPKVVRKALDHGVSHETQRVEEKFQVLDKKAFGRDSKRNRSGLRENTALQIALEFRPPPVGRGRF